MRFPSAAVISSLLALVVADGRDIVYAMRHVADETQQLGSTVSSWGGGIFGALDIKSQSDEVLDAIESAAGTAQSSAPLNAIEAITISQETLALTQDVQQTLSAIVAAKPDFEHLFISSITLSSLESQRDASNSLSQAVADKVPSHLQAAAQKLGANIDALFASAIAAYNDDGDSDSSDAGENQ